ncbi:MAG: DUF2156 domain-containing protein [Solirubrobacterales bacterium]|nr:DUF2156 domain-containing protein [Solirubrobacterales bacterium]
MSVTTPTGRSTLRLERGETSRRPLPGPLSDEYLAARAIVAKHGHDSLARFVLRPDKSFHFAFGGMLAYRVIGNTAVVSSDPVAPAGAEGGVLSSFVDSARRRGWKVVVWGASQQHLEAYRALGFRWSCAGEEAFVDPTRFTLEGRRVRKLRQSVHRVNRRGWNLEAVSAAELRAEAWVDIARFERNWRAEQSRVHGFAMSFGKFDSDVEENDVYLLARSPEGELRALMLFVSHCGGLSLDSMHRLGETPNGLNEALVCCALDRARADDVRAVSLNYAGLGHLVRGVQPAGRIRHLVNQAALGALARHFQMERLVRFNEKFFPEWRPRFLVYQSRAALPLAVVRVLQAEGYLAEPHPLRSLRIPQRADGGGWAAER